MKKVRRFLVISIIFIIAFGTLSSEDVNFSGLWTKIKSGVGKILEEKENTGKASYYADKYVGSQTSNGEIFRQDKLTAAHRSFPMGTKVKVTNLGNGRSVVVRINDRGPFVRGRDIDLSKAAARKIGLMKSGVAEVRMEVVQ